VSAIDLDYLCQWVGRKRETIDTIHPGPVKALSAALGHEPARVGSGKKLPACWHWLYFLDYVPAGNIAQDGHPERGDFLPPVPLPRRMWAGGELEFHTAVHVGDTLCRVSTIENVEHKLGRSGELVFVTVNHRYLRGEQLCIEERQDLVYRESTGVAQVPAESLEERIEADFSRRLTPDPVLLFRYSALTFNSHRIHYDQAYASGEESYPGLVVQGPLTATLLLDALYRYLPHISPCSFSFRSQSALYCDNLLTLNVRQQQDVLELAAQNSEGVVAMQAMVK
jgi:3-methylfumaryl-CoA hydratase